LCRELEIPTLVVAANTAIPRRKSDWEAMMALLARAAAMAGEAQVRLALEFQAASPMCNNLQTAASAVEECGSTWLGLCLDSFHFYVGPSKTEDLACLTSENLFHVQLSDLAGVPREMAADGDRILPGDGELPLAAIVEACRRLNYGGYVSIELMNPQIWRVPALQFGEVAMKSLSAILAATS
jgi:sugar phosphate isomerase/epimerase